MTPKVEVKQLNKSDIELVLLLSAQIFNQKIGEYHHVAQKWDSGQTKVKSFLSKSL